MRIGPIRTKSDHEAMLARAASLMSKRDRRSTDELEVLQVLIERWEAAHHQIPSPSPLEAIRFRMAQGGLKPRDLEPMLGSKSRVYEILAGTRPLSLDMIRALHRHLAIPAASLIAGADAAAPRLPSKAAVEKIVSFGVLRPNEDVAAFVARAMPRDAEPSLLRKSRTTRTNAKTDAAALDAWCAAVFSLVRLPAPRRSPPKREWARDIAALSVKADGPRHVSEALADMGIGFATLEHLPGTYLDGAALRAPGRAPVIALTLRHDRLDNFWFTLLHEFAHVCLHLDARTTMIFDDLEIGGEEGIEAEADLFAQDALIAPQFWREADTVDLNPAGLVAIAERANVHPAVVAGRWQRRFGDYRRFSKLLGRGEVRAFFR